MGQSILAMMPRPGTNGNVGSHALALSFCLQKKGHLLTMAIEIVDLPIENADFPWLSTSDSLLGFMLFESFWWIDHHYLEPYMHEFDAPQIQSSSWGPIILL